METAEKDGHLPGSLRTQGILLAPKDIRHNIQSQKPKHNNSVNIFFIGHFWLEKFAELRDVGSHAVNQCVQVAVLEALKKIVAGGGSTAVVKIPECGLDALPGPHSFIETCLGGRFRVNYFHCVFVTGVNLIGSNDYQSAISVVL
jgi:hypothetical protein